MALNCFEELYIIRFIEMRHEKGSFMTIIQSNFSSAFSRASNVLKQMGVKVSPEQTAQKALHYASESDISRNRGLAHYLTWLVALPFVALSPAAIALPATLAHAALALVGATFGVDSLVKGVKATEIAKSLKGDDVSKLSQLV
jgi:hypothetical protein